MRRTLRFLAIAVPAALATVPVALAGPDLATGDAPDRASALVGESAPHALPTDTFRVAGAAIRAGASEARAQAPAPIVAVDGGETVLLRSRPGGPGAVEETSTAEFGSPQRLGVVRERGAWLGVSTPELPNGKLGWVHRRDGAITVRRTAWSIVADVSSRRIVLRRAGRVVRRLGVAVGRPDSPTPTGRFSVTDKIAGDRFGPYYGCCILAISATQPNTPPGWTGGNRMAIHGTSDPTSIGAAASAGCLRAADSDLRLLMRRVPLGTPVIIRP